MSHRGAPVWTRDREMGPGCAPQYRRRWPYGDVGPGSRARLTSKRSTRRPTWPSALWSGVSVQRGQAGRSWS
ncbi:hypothetical protein BOTBODRAFT_67196 [Botryobasidium botryosum FD-172 SS1]|uniref:Uncharacterized protein n=1 Tax=Botryobasidium botryosum (strain FD-172 SS1) TaxID=930990 RepID=A0A067MAX1_BOTB1|nr:hypothetical protein BOTBODRAFT_67196 [Botryobasidium botryosum FD-172 SS1]